MLSRILTRAIHFFVGVIREPSFRASVFTLIPDSPLKDAQRTVAEFIERLIDYKVAEIGNSIDKKLRQDVGLSFEFWKWNLLHFPHRCYLVARSLLSQDRPH